MEKGMESVKNQKTKNSNVERVRDMDTIKLNVLISQRKNKSYFVTLSNDNDEDGDSSSNSEEEIRTLISCLSPSSAQETMALDSITKVSSEMP